MTLAADRAPPLSPLSVVDDDRRRHFRETGKFYGYPPCCVEAFVKNAVVQRNSALRQRNAAHGFVPCQKHARLLESGAIKHADLIADRSPNAPATIEEDELAQDEGGEMELGDEFATAELLYDCSREFDVLADAMLPGTSKQLHYRSLASRCFEAAEMLDDDDVFDEANEAAAFEAAP